MYQKARQGFVENPSRREAKQSYLWRALRRASFKKSPQGIERLNSVQGPKPQEKGKAAQEHRRTTSQDLVQRKHRIGERKIQEGP